jgi:hypothetical protein
MGGQQLKYVNGKASLETCKCLHCDDGTYGCNHFNNPPLKEQQEDYWTTPEGIRRRIRGLAQDFTYKVVNGAVKRYGQFNGALWLYWQTVGDDRVCVICTKAATGGRNGFYKPQWFTPQMPAHFGCRCQWFTYWTEID